ncbi:hypothetical protein D3C75_1326090 [compost metagenome]
MNGRELRIGIITEEVQQLVSQFMAVQMPEQTIGGNPLVRGQLTEDIGLDLGKRNRVI